MWKAFERASGQRVAYRIMPRRLGDIAQTYADPAKAESQLGWAAKRDLQAMMRDAWNWQSNNPEGYQQPTSVEAASAG